MLYCYLHFCHLYLLLALGPLHLAPPHQFDVIAKVHSSRLYAPWHADELHFLPFVVVMPHIVHYAYVLIPTTVIATIVHAPHGWLRLIRLLRIIHPRLTRRTNTRLRHRCGFCVRVMVPASRLSTSTLLAALSVCHWAFVKALALMTSICSRITRSSTRASDQ